MVKMHDKTLYVFAVNIGSKPATVRFTPEKFAIQSITEHLTSKTLPQTGKQPFGGTLKPCDVRVYRVEMK